MNIRLVSDELIVHRPRRLSVAEQEVVTETINKLLEKGIIRPSKSNYASPIVLVDKKDGKKEAMRRLSCT